MLKDIKLSGTGSGQFKIQVSNDGSSWDYRRNSLTVTEVEQSIRIRLDSDFVWFQYYRIVRTGDTGDLGTLKIQLSEFNVLYATAMLLMLRHLTLALKQTGITYVLLLEALIRHPSFW